MNTIKTACLIGFSLLSGVLAAQEKGSFRFGGDLGYMMPKDGGGISYHIEPKYYITDQINVGFKYGGTASVRIAESTHPDLEGEEADLGFSATYLGTADYYLNTSDHAFVPYVGGGVGVFHTANVTFSDDFRAGESTKFGGMVRGGFETGRFRMGVEYMLIPETKLESVLLGKQAGTISNSYLNIHVGYFIDLDF